MPQLLSEKDDKRTRRVIDLDAVVSRSLINQETLKALASANQAATMAIASIPTGIFAQIAQAQQLVSYFEPIRRAMEIFQERMQKMWEQIREALDRLIKPLTFVFSTRPIYLLHPQPVTEEKRLDRHLSVEQNTYGFFMIDNEKLNILHPASSRCGKLLKALLTRRARVVDYQTLREEIGTRDLDKTFKDLKYQLKQHGYRLEYERPRTQGIVLIGLAKLQ